MKLLFFGLALVSTVVFGQKTEQLNGKWIAFADTSENLMYTRDTILFTIETNYDINGCVYHVPVRFRKDSVAYIQPEWWCGGDRWGNHSPYIPRGLLFFDEPGKLRWIVELWDEDLNIFFYGTVYYSYLLESNKLTLIRDRAQD